MAITVNDDKPNSGQRLRSIPFSGTTGLMGATRGSEYTTQIAKVMQEMYANLPVPPKVNVFDKERITNLAFSCIVVSMPNKAGEVCYHISLLESTGLDPLKAIDIVNEVARSVRERNNPARVYTPSDAINGLLNDIVLDQLEQQYKNATFLSTDGMVVPASTLDPVDLAMRVAAIAYNSVYTEALLSGDSESAEFADLNIADALAENGRSIMKLEYNTYNTTVPNVIGRATRQDFKLDLVETSQDTSFELNAESRNRLVSVAGFVDAIREEIPMHVQPGMPAASTTRLHPNIVITNNDTISPTHGFMLLGLAAATVLSRPELWIQSLASIDAKSPNNPGNLNILTNIEGGQAGIPLDFSSKSVTPEEQYGALKQMYSLSPVISYDIDVYGPQSYYTSLLDVAASPASAGNSRVDALNELIDTCVQLTNGNFPNDFNINHVFATEGIVIPTGYWMDKSGERDIRDVDLAFIASQTKDVNTVNKWGMTSLPRTVTGLDPFLTRVDLISQIIPDAVINGKAVRVTFTNAFLSALTIAVEKAGLVANYETSVVINEQYSTAQFTDYLAAAGLSSVGGFARQGGATGPGLYTAYSNMGNYRF